MPGYITLTATMTSGDSITGALQIGEPKERVYALLPSLSTNAALEVYGATELTGTYYRVMHPVINSSTVATNPFRIASGITGWVQIPADFPYLKLHATGAVDNGATYTILCR